MRLLKICFFAIGLSFVLNSCSNCGEFATEQYPEPDTLTLLSKPLRHLRGTYEKIGEFEIPLPKDRAYRMYYKFSFEECAYVMHLTKTQNGCMIACRYVNWIPSDASWETISVEWTNKTMSMRQWNEFENRMIEAKFWTMPQHIDRQGADGHTIFLEGYRPQAAACGKRTYHLIHRWSPEAGPLRDAVDMLIGYAELEELPRGR